MAQNFKDRIQTLTNSTITSNSNPVNNDDLNQFLSDGAKDVILKVLRIFPKKTYIFATTSFVPAGGLDVESGMVTSVMRLDGESPAGADFTGYNPASQILPMMVGKATDKYSLDYRSKFNPAFYIEAGKLHVLPTPGGANNLAKATYVHFPTVSHTDTSIGKDERTLAGAVFVAGTDYFNYNDHGLEVNDFVELEGWEGTESQHWNGVRDMVNLVPTSSAFRIRNIAGTLDDTDTVGTISRRGYGFPVEYEHLVTVYAAMKVLQSKMAAMESSEDLVAPSKPVLEVLNQVLPQAPLFPNFVAPEELKTMLLNYGTLPVIDTYEKPAFVMPVMEDIRALIVPSRPISPSTINSILGFSETPPSYNMPTTVPNYGNADFWITDEDSELAKSRVDVINSQLQEYGADIQNELNKFNSAQTVYTSQLQQKIEEAKITDKNNITKLQKYQSEIQEYQVAVNASIQEWTTEHYTPAMTEWQSKVSSAIEEYKVNVQNEASKIQLQVQSHKEKIDKSLKKYQAESQFNIAQAQSLLQTRVMEFDKALQKETNTFNNQIARFKEAQSVVVNKNNQAIQEFAAASTLYGTKLQKDTIKYTWLQTQLKTLDNEYADAFLLMRKETKKPDTNQDNINTNKRRKRSR